MDMKKLLNIVSDKKSQLNECSEMGGMPAPAVPQVPPVSMNVNLNAQGIDQIKDLLSLMNKVDAPLAPGAVPMGAPMPPEPMPAVATDMPVAIKAIGGNEKGPEDSTDPLDDLVKKAGIAVKKPEAEKEEEADLSQMADEVRDMADTLANTPDEKIAGLDAAVPSGDDLHKEKKMYKKAQDGDNPMAAESSIKSTLMKLYQELKEGKKAKPDFLDVDKDGNKSEPMKKALKDKKVKESSKEDEDEEMEEGFDAGTKTGATKKTATGTLTKTATGVRHTRDKFEYDPGSDDKDDKKRKAKAKK